MLNAISVDNLTYEYPGTEDTKPFPVFENLNLQIKDGTFVAILGHNGCGKSTLAKHFNSILLPCGGSVSVYGMDSCDESVLINIRRTVGMVFQNPDNQIVSNIVEEDVAFAPENLGVDPAEIRRRVDEALKLVGMYSFREHAPHMLSGGQKQRIAIAGVIAMEPRCIVLDEPTAMLDPHGRQEVLKTISALNKEKGITVILITHHMSEAALADRIVVMHEGKIIADGTPKEVFSDVEHMYAAQLSVPETTQLLHELNMEGYNLPLDALSVDECAQVLCDFLTET